MNYKNKIFLLIIVFILLLGSGFILMNVTQTGICSGSDTCIIVASEWFGAPLVIGSAFVLISLFPLIFLQKAYSSWKKFFICFLPLWVLLIALTPTYGGQQILPFLPIDKSISAILLGIAYLIVSLGIIIYQTLKNKKMG